MEIDNLSARAWTVKSNIGTQTDDKKISYLLNSWEDGSTTYTITAPSGKWLSGIEIPFRADWALIEYTDAIIGGTASYTIEKF